MNPRLLVNNSEYLKIAQEEFTSVTAENHMKMMLIHPEENRFEFSLGDAIVQFAQVNNQRIHGHTLVWHNQVPKWMQAFTGDAKAWEDMLKNHIQTVVRHYKGQVAGWDVVNEAFLDDGSLRPTIWSKNIPDYIVKSFQWAHEADPEALLFYNDYGQDGNPKKMQAILDMLHDLQARHIPIHGLGLQMHINIQAKNEDIRRVIEQSTATGLAIHFSELDVAVNPKNDSTFVYDDAAKAAQLEKLLLVFQAYRAIPKNQQYGITFWNVGDRDSWLRGYFKRPKEYPLLFDETYNRKASYSTLLNNEK
jgi:endo-1,4-beta-xylanase